MQTSQAITSNYKNVAKITDPAPVNRAGGWLSKLFGCRHKEMSRPFSSQGQTYRSCVDCGARRQFNVRQWEMQGDFYYRLPSTKYFRALNGLTAAQ